MSRLGVLALCIILRDKSAKELIGLSNRRAGLMSMASEPQLTTKDKLWRYCCLWDCSPTFTKIQEYVNLFIMDAFVDLFITLCILVNTLFMALDKHNMNKDLENVSASANLVCKKIIHFHPVSLLRTLLTICSAFGLVLLFFF